MNFIYLGVLIWLVYQAWLMWQTRKHLIELQKSLREANTNFVKLIKIMLTENRK